jgi:DNA-binding transcriptional MerR regulator/methylmalonyl-CoA mutase cobalamin-binding subunit
MSSRADEPRHPIAVAAERAGLSQDILRAWERRYRAVTPSRSPCGQRLYSDADVERLRLMQVTSRQGRSVSQVAAMTTEELARMAAEDAEHAHVDDASRAEKILDEALLHVKALDAAALGRELARAATSLGLAGFIDAVAAPLMRRVGDDWHAGTLTIAHEHLASAVLRDLLLDVMRGFANQAGPRIVVATPSGERHEIGAAMAGASAAADVWSVIYLGADVPAADIVRATRAAGAIAVALSVVYHARPELLLEEIGQIRATLPRDISVLVGGAAATDVGVSLRAMGLTPATRLHFAPGKS